MRPVSGLRIQRLHREPVVVAMAEDHPLATRPTLRLVDLAGWAVVKLPRERARLIDDLLRSIPADTGAAPAGSPAAVAQEANQYMTLLALVAAGMGVALVPDSVRPLRLSGMRYLALDEPSASTSLMVATRAEPGHPAADQLRTVLVEEFGDAVQARS
ncbi:LysR family substrate-binding domain-containing protein [Ornithinimicrobium sp.]|uniref:LysR family substrate-binding domain-containing protein n=1 Tax=Ornithinimicrobium sp. TaxID=1977084 RepID=UPI003D9B54A0